MSDRSYRFILGLSILISLFLKLDYAIYLIIGMMLIEAVTNYRLPILINQFKSSTSQSHHDDIEKCPYFGIEAERLFRFIVVVLITLGCIIYPDSLWFFPWFVGLNLILAGITGICPLVMLLRKLGFS